MIIILNEERETRSEAGFDRPGEGRARCGYVRKGSRGSQLASLCVGADSSFWRQLPPCQSNQ